MTLLILTDNISVVLRTATTSTLIQKGEEITTEQFYLAQHIQETSRGKRAFSQAGGATVNEKAKKDNCGIDGQEFEWK